jgi:hypothetical protein
MSSTRNFWHITLVSTMVPSCVPGESYCDQTFDTACCLGWRIWSPCTRTGGWTGRRGGSKWWSLARQWNKWDRPWSGDGERRGGRTTPASHIKRGHSRRKTGKQSQSNNTLLDKVRTSTNIGDQSASD